MARNTLGHLSALHVTLAHADDRSQVEQLATAVRALTDDHVAIAVVDQGSTHEKPATAARAHSIELDIVKLSEADGNTRVEPSGTIRRP